MSGATTRRCVASRGSTSRQLAQALTPGPEPWTNSTGGCPGADVPWSCTLLSKAPVRTFLPISGFAVLIVRPSQLHAHVAQLGVELERVHAAFAADARGLRSAEGGAQVAQEPAVDPADADLDLPGHAVRGAEVLGPHRGGESVVGGIGQRDRLLFGVERRDVAARAEDLLADHRGRFRQAGPDRRLHPMAFGQHAAHLRHAAAGDDSGVLLHRLAVVAQHLVAVLGRDQRPQAHAGLFRGADLQRLGLGLQRLHELLEDRPLHVDALGAQADLAAVLEGAAGDARHRPVEVGIGEHDAGVLAAELEAHRPHTLGGRGHDGLAGARLAREGDAVHARVRGEELAGRVGPEAMHHVVDARRDADRVHHLAQQRGGGRRFFRGLDHHRVAAGQRGPDLPGPMYSALI
eukprot:Opistho-1_new@105924